MSDRERLEQMANEAEAQRTKAKLEKEQEEAERKRTAEAAAEESKQKTAELKAYCDATFKGFQLIPTGHDVSVSTAYSSRLHTIESDGGEYIVLTVTHWDDETGGFQGQIPIVMCRYHKNPVATTGVYEWVVGTGTKQIHVGTFEQFKEALLRAVASLGRDQMGAIFREVKNRLRR